MAQCWSSACNGARRCGAALELPQRGSRTPFALERRPQTLTSVQSADTTASTTSRRTRTTTRNTCREQEVECSITGRRRVRRVHSHLGNTSVDLLRYRFVREATLQVIDPRGPVSLTRRASGTGRLEDNPLAVQLQSVAPCSVEPTLHSWRNIDPYEEPYHGSTRRSTTPERGRTC